MAVLFPAPVLIRVPISIAISIAIWIWRVEGMVYWEDLMHSVGSRPALA